MYFSIFELIGFLQEDQGSYIITEEDEEEETFVGRMDKFSAVCHGKEKKTCETLQERGLNKWSLSTKAWSEILSAIKDGGLAVVTNALQTTIADRIFQDLSGLSAEFFAVQQEKAAYKQYRNSNLLVQHYSPGIKEIKRFFDSTEIRNVLGKVSGVNLDGPLLFDVVYRRPGDHERMRSTADNHRDEKQKVLEYSKDEPVRV
uniref:Uncharacterized protein n=1 Tax=Guillardia theta TaxID=55529 RepID=A0A7S4KJT4_GUITH|mmetsp:Transcript_26098/g.85835  ORF Transcript_26098/g.85835 Transcript_26098/m.85835 type:complete len:202 (+) Transcript_26098:222-827(+)